MSRDEASFDDVRRVQEQVEDLRRDFTSYQSEQAHIGLESRTEIWDHVSELREFFEDLARRNDAIVKRIEALELKLAENLQEIAADLDLLRSK